MNSLQPSAFNLAPPPTLQWQPVQIANFTAVAGRAYPCNTTSAAFTVTLPASPSAGDQVQLLDYAGTWGTNNLTVARNGNNINGGTTNVLLTTNRGSVTLTYVDATQGWVGSDAIGILSLFVPVTYLLLAGGGGGGYDAAGGGGAGGLLESSINVSLNVATSITVGGGGAGSTASGGGANGGRGTSGNQSIFASLTAVPGGGGGGNNSTTTTLRNGLDGGSGGGGADGGGTAGNGTAGQGSAGGIAQAVGSYSRGGGGGGATTAGGNGSSGSGAGGTGKTSTISGSSVVYGGGGGGGGDTRGVTGGAAGSGGGGAGGGSDRTPAQAGTANRGGGGGGGCYNNALAAAGGSGIVILKIPSAYTATFSGGVTSSVSTAVAGFKIYTVTATSTTSETVTFS